MLSRRQLQIYLLVGGKIRHLLICVKLLQFCGR